MNPLRYVPPAIEPISLSEAKAHLRVDHTDEDGYMQSLITVAREAAETRTERTLIQSTWRLVLDRFPQSIPLPMPPIVSVSQITYVDLSGNAVALNPADYFVDTASEPGWVLPVKGKTFPQTDTVNAVTVTYVAGYGVTAQSVPAPIRHWILLALGDLYDQIRSVSAEKPRVPQNFADSLINPYRFFGV